MDQRISRVAFILEADLKLSYLLQKKHKVQNFTERRRHQNIGFFNAKKKGY